jgi:hypothetical protein
VTIFEQVVQNKSSLLPKIILQTTQALQLFTTMIKTESVYKSLKKAKLEGLSAET